MKNTTQTYLLLIEAPDKVLELNICHTVINQNSENMLVTISTTLQGNEITLHAETTEDALIQLARGLQEGWRIKSCLSCRYGHFCPVGDCDNELFCVTDFDPKEVRDLWHITEDTEERLKRSHTLFDLCDRYAPQTEDYFTYSDYYFRINNEKS